MFGSDNFLDDLIKFKIYLKFLMGYVIKRSRFFSVFYLLDGIVLAIGWYTRHF